MIKQQLKHLLFKFLSMFTILALLFIGHYFRLYNINNHLFSLIIVFIGIIILGQAILLITGLIDIIHHCQYFSKKL